MRLKIKKNHQKDLGKKKTLNLFGGFFCFFGRLCNIMSVCVLCVCVYVIYVLVVYI